MNVSVVRPSSVRPSSVCQHFQTTSPLKPGGRFFIASIGRGTKSCHFYSNRIRILVAMATHRLIMGKEEIDNFFCLIGDILIFLQKC